MKTISVKWFFSEPIDPCSQAQRFTAASHKVFVILVNSYNLFQKAVVHVLSYMSLKHKEIPRKS